MRILSFCFCCMYALAVLFDIIFMKTGIFGYKYAGWISILLGAVGNMCLAIISWNKRQKAGNSKTENDSGS